MVSHGSHRWRHGACFQSCAKCGLRQAAEACWVRLLLAWGWPCMQVDAAHRVG